MRVAIYNDYLSYKTLTFFIDSINLTLLHYELRTYDDATVLAHNKKDTRISRVPHQKSHPTVPYLASVADMS